MLTLIKRLFKKDTVEVPKELLRSILPVVRHSRAVWKDGKERGRSPLHYKVNSIDFVVQR